MMTAVNRNHSKTINILWLVLFAASGASSLTYQVVWQRVLTQEIGIDSVSVTLIVAIFMLGLGLGSLVGASLAARLRNVVAALGIIELVIGVFGFISVDLLRTFNSELLVGAELSERVIANFGLLLLPTLLMGATTPLMVEIYRDDISRGQSTGSAYAANIVGAALGVLACGFLLVGTYGLTSTAHLVAALDIAIAALFLGLAYKRDVSTSQITVSNQATLPGILLAGVFLIGVANLGYELVFFRLFTSYFGVTPYVFPMLLFAYLANMAWGTWLGGWLSARWKLEKIFFVSILATLVLSLPILWLQQYLLNFGQAQLRWVFDPARTIPDQNISQLMEALGLSLALLLPVAASSMLLPAIVSASGRDLHKGTLFGRLYFTQTIGNTVGSIITGFILYAALDSPKVLALLALLLVAGVGLVIFSTKSQPTLRIWAPATLAALAIIGTFNFNYANSVRYFRSADQATPPVWTRDTLHGMTLVYDRHGDNSSYAALAGGRFWITGIPGRTGWKRSVNSMKPIFFGHNPDVRRILFIGLGTGEELLLLRDIYPNAELTIVEINPDLIDAFNNFAYEPIVREIRKSKVFLTDGRRFLQSHPQEKFDYIHLGVDRASTSGAGNLFSRDMLSLLRKHLSRRGMVTFYAYPPVVKGALDVFSDVNVATDNDNIGITYCTNETLQHESAAFKQRYAEALAKLNNAPLHPKQPHWMPGEPVIYSKDALKSILRTVPTATDDHLVTEYYLNNTSELIPGLHRESKPVDFRRWPFQEQGKPFFSGIHQDEYSLAAHSTTSWAGEKLASSITNGPETPPFIIGTGNVQIKGLSENPKMGYQWNLPQPTLVSLSTDNYLWATTTCLKQGRGLWGIKAMVTSHSGETQLKDIQTAAQGPSTLNLMIAVPRMAKEVSFYLTFDNAPGLGDQTKLECREFSTRAFHSSL